MKAVVQERFGTPDTLRLADVDPPRPGPGEVLVRVRAAAVNPYDWHVLRGDPRIARLSPMVGLTRPAARIAGVDAAGQVEAVGPDVHGLAVGDEVLGFVRGAFAEYAVAPAGAVVPRPAALSAEEAAALPMAGTTALRGVLDVGAVRRGTRLLVIGAGGGIGTFAVQIATALGAEVTGVCSTAKLGLVRSLGAQHVVDHTVEDVTERPERYDVVLDNVGHLPLRRIRRVLTPDGTLVLNGGGSPGHVFGAVGTLVRAMLLDRVVRQRLLQLPTRTDRAELLALTDLVADGRVRPVVDRTYTLPEVAEALRRVEAGHTRGKLVVTIG
jgi:NADPH:quinone reductase-like Zn-dependent oxidoreductase